MSDHIPAAVEELFALDDGRIARSKHLLAAQDVERYEIDVCVNPGRGWLSGQCRLIARVESPTMELELNEALTVLSMQTAGGDYLDFDRRGRELEVLLAPAGGTTRPHGDESAVVELLVRYEGLVPLAREPNDDGGDLVILTGEDAWYPSSWAGDAALFRATVRYPVGQSCLFTGTLSGMASSPATPSASCAGGDVWQTEIPIRSAALVVGALDSSWGLVGKLFLGYHQFRETDDPDAERHTQLLAPTAQAMKEPIRFLETCFGPYPYDWLNVLTVPVGALGVPAISGPGLIIVEEATSGNGVVGPPAPDKYILELARSWWGHSVAGGALISEGIAAHAEIRWLEDVRGEEEATLRRALRHRQFARVIADSSGRALLSLCTAPDAHCDRGIARGRGSAVMGMLDEMLGHDAYCEALTTLAQDHAGEITGLRDLAGVLSDASGKDLDWFFYEWIYRAELPVYVLEYEIVPHGGGYLVRGTITQSGEFFRTPVPLTLDLGGWTYDEWVTIESATQSFEFEAELEPVQIGIDARKIIPRVDQVERAKLHFEQGARAANANRWRAAVDEFGAAVSLNPGRAAYEYRYGEALVRSGRFTDGLAALRSAIELKPGNASYVLWVARLETAAGDDAAALEHLYRYVELRPRDIVGHSDRAIVLLKLGRTEEAVLSLETASELVSEGVASRGAMERFHIASGMLHAANGASEAALLSYRDALNANPVCDEARGLILELEAVEETEPE
jgi:tetratricopeptide (TPR) repeat protein